MNRTTIITYHCAMDSIAEVTFSTKRRYEAGVDVDNFAGIMGRNAIEMHPTSHYDEIRIKFVEYISYSSAIFI